MVDELLKASQAARYLGVTRQRIYELALVGRLGQRMAGYWVFSKAELDLYREQRTDNHGGRPSHKQGRATADENGRQHVEAREPRKQGAVEQYLEAALRYVAVQPLSSGGYVGASLDFPELNTFGVTRSECVNCLQIELERLIREKLRLGQPLPAIDGVTLSPADEAA